MTAANTVARSFGLVFLVRKPKIDEPAPVPMPEKKIITSIKYGHAEGERRTIRCYCSITSADLLITVEKRAEICVC